MASCQSRGCAGNGVFPDAEHDIVSDKRLSMFVSKAVHNMVSMKRLCMAGYQEASLHCLEHAALHIQPHHHLVDPGQTIADRHGLLQPVAPPHAILLQGVKLALLDG